MKILTLQFLTCAIKTCKSKTISSSTTSPQDGPSSSTSPFPLHPVSASLERSSLPFNPTFVLNILPRLDFAALQLTATEFGVVALLPAPDSKPWERLQDAEWRMGMLGRVAAGEIKGSEPDDEDRNNEDVEMMKAEGEEAQITEKDGPSDDEDVVMLRNLHTLLLETEMVEGKLRCGNCGHEYGVREGVGNFLLPAHLV